MKRLIKDKVIWANYGRRKSLRSTFLYIESQKRKSKNEPRKVGDPHQNTFDRGRADRVENVNLIKGLQGRYLFPERGEGENHCLPTF